MEEESVIHSKTDQQQKRLTEGVGGILIFKSLDPDQMLEVIDPMFEHHVEPGDLIIKQGSDGDNFHVIESGTYDGLVKRTMARKIDTSA